MENNKQTPIADLRAKALKHYQLASEAIMEHHSEIPKAIMEYYDRKSLPQTDAGWSFFDKDAPLERRRGMIDIPRGFLSDEQKKVLFSAFFPEFVDDRGGIFDLSVKFYGTSPYFDPIEEGTLIPTYEVCFDSSKRGPVQFYFIRVDN